MAQQSKLDMVLDQAAALRMSYTKEVRQATPYGATVFQAFEYYYPEAALVLEGTDLDPRNNLPGFIKMMENS